jgi:hypothetical protein
LVKCNVCTVWNPHIWNSKIWKDLKSGKFFLPEEHISVDKCNTLTEELVKKREQKSFISEQHIIWVYKMQEVKNTAMNETVNFARHV